MANPDEADIAASAGADMLGLVGPMPSGAGIIDIAMAREISQAVPAWVTPVLLTQGDTVEAIAADIAETGVRAVQLVRHVAPEVHHKLAERLPWVRRIQVVHIETDQSLDHVAMYEDLIDAFLLDSGRPSQAELGGTGRVHDWSISAEFVRRTRVPVFLAGGLSADNVAEAITTVRPFGVDICSGVRTEDRL
ncbi:MAG: phosphoribosylanthranilate isomerase, partial [Pseudomonadota bacterium]